MNIQMTRVVEIDAPGGADAMHIRERPVGEPAAGEVRIRHTAIGLNYIDIYFRSGVYPMPAQPAVLGMEAAGVVEAVGEGVDHVKVGDRVAYAGRPMGAYADARVMPAWMLVSLPDSITDETAASMMLKGMTVHYLFHRCETLRPDQTILFHAAAGGVGQIACQWARQIGVRLIATAGSDEKCEIALQQGADAAINYRTESFPERVRALTDGRGVDVVYDSVGALTFEGSLASLAKYGHLVSFGNASGKVPPVDLALLQGHLKLSRPSLMPYTATRPELLESALPLIDKVGSGQIQIPVAQRWALADVRLAHESLESRATVGCTVLKP